MVTLRSAARTRSGRSAPHIQLSTARRVQAIKARTVQRKIPHGSAVIEVEHVELPFSFRSRSKDTDIGHGSQCAVNRDARLAKRITSNNRYTRNQSTAVQTNFNRIESHRRYHPENIAVMNKHELLTWQRHQQQLRNRQTAAECYHGKKVYIKELEQKILDIKMNYEHVQRQIEILEGEKQQQQQRTLLTSSGNSNQNDTCVVREESQQLFFRHRQSSGIEDTIALPRFFSSTPTVQI